MSKPLILMAALSVTVTASAAAYLAGVRAGEQRVAAAATPARPALDVGIAKLTESLYVARQLDAQANVAARDYLGMSIDLDVLALGESLDSLPAQQRAAVLSVLADVYAYRSGKPAGLVIPREQLAGVASGADLRAEVEAVLAHAAANAPTGGLAF